MPAAKPGGRSEEYAKREIVNTILYVLRSGGAWRLARAEQVRFRHFVQPGDQMELAVELKEFSPTAAALGASVRVDDKVVATARKLRMVLRESVKAP